MPPNLWRRSRTRKRNGGMGGRVKAGKGSTRACRGEKQPWQKQLKQETRKPVL